jgi:hypothetical protein
MKPNANSVPSAVIPAKAGIHLDLRFFMQSKMDSRFRGNDDPSCFSRALRSSYPTPRQ